MAIKIGKYRFALNLKSLAKFIVSGGGAAVVGLLYGERAAAIAVGIGGVILSQSDALVEKQPVAEAPAAAAPAVDAPAVNDQ